MAAAAVENTLLDKISNFVNDNAYRDLMQNAAKFNTRIRKDRVYRQPYIDGQTGIAQNHCHLFVSEKQRMPGILQGQVYTYPARRWRVAHRSYLASFIEATAKATDPDEHTITTVENPAALVTVAAVEENIPAIDPTKVMQEPWSFYEEPTYEEDLEEEFESEEDYDDETYNRKGSKKKKPPGRKPKVRSAKKRPAPKPSATANKLIKNIRKEEAPNNDPDHKPYVCQLCGMRYKTRPGLTYHYSHSHKDDPEDEVKTKTVPPTPTLGGAPTPVLPDTPAKKDQAPFLGSCPSPTPPLAPWTESNGTPGGRTANRTNRSAAATASTASTTVSATPVRSNTNGTVSSQAELIVEPEKKKTVASSPYCDFCLGDANENKKTGQAEQLVSCADCGRSGHPSCLQFTDNMMKSVLRYRWQCIECKTCTLCGTSENDDQLLFCDDCDRGYHLYCLSPPLQEPPEGEWSCSLCLHEFHNK